MPGISIHVVDVAHGVPGTGMRVDLLRDATVLVTGVIDLRGLLDDHRLNARFEPGSFEARFHVAEYYCGRGLSLPEPPFLDVVPYCFGLAFADQHYHLPFKMTPWGYSCFRGGA